ncbi:MAG: glycoside hydrolase family 66 protein [Candidatus Omnitrophota bacterium]
MKRKCLWLGSVGLFLVVGLLALSVPQVRAEEVLIKENFENISLDSLPAGWGIAVSGGAKISVIKKEGENQGKCLKFQNATDANQSSEPDLEIAVPMKGTVRLSFDILPEDANSPFTVAPRMDWTPDRPNGFAGPYLVIGKEGRISAKCANNWVDFGEMPAGKWVHVEMVMRMKGYGDVSWDLSIKVPSTTSEGQVRTYKGLAYLVLEQAPEMLNRLVFHGTNQNSAATYFDNLTLEIIEIPAAAKPQATKTENDDRLLTEKRDSPAVPSASGETANLCLRIPKPEITVNSFIAGFGESNHATVAKRLIDGDVKTYWLSGSRKTAITVKFPNPVTVSQSYWFHANIPTGILDERGFKDYTIETSLDGIKWQEVVSVRDYKGGKRYDTFTSHTAKYVKLNILQCQGFLLPCLCEWELYETPKVYPAGEDKPAVSFNVPLIAKTLSAGVSSDKILYAPGESPKFTIVINNNRRKDAQLHIILLLRRGVEEPTVIKEWNTFLRNGSSKSLNYICHNIRDEYGYLLRAIIKEDGVEIAQSDCVFEMADNWAKIARYNGDSGEEKLVSDFPQEEIDRVHIPLWRKLHLNCIEMFGQHVFFNQHFTDNDEWNSPYPNHFNRRVSAKTTQMWVKACKDNGIRILTYSESGALSPELKFDLIHPEWIVYGPLKFPDATKYLYTMWMYFPDMAGTFPAGKPVVAPDLHYNDVGDMRAMTGYLAKDFAQATKRFGWEGCFFDSLPWAFEDSAFGCDKNGKPLNVLSPDEIGAQFLSQLKKEIYKDTGVKFVPVANFGLPEGLSPWREVNPDLQDFRKSRAIYRKTASEMGIFCVEQQSFPTWKDPSGQYIYPQTIEETVRALRLIREANDVNVPVMLLPLRYVTGLSQTPVDANFLYSSAAASGVLLFMGRVTLPRRVLELSMSEDPAMEVEANYNRFASRYGEYLFDLNIRWLPKEEVECFVPENVWWKDLVSCRKYGDGRFDIYVHLINRPDFPMTWGKTLGIPKPLNDVSVSVKNQEKKKLAGIWAISPNGSHDPQRLEVKEEDGKSVVIIPRLDYWMMLVCKFEEG